MLLAARFPHRLRNSPTRPPPFLSDRDHPSLRDVLPKDYASPCLGKHRLGELPDLIFTTRRLAIMNLAIPGIEVGIGHGDARTFRNGQQPDLRADHVLANRPFNGADWLRKNDSARRATPL